MLKLYPDPGVLPTKPSPIPGEKIVINLSGLPPFKDTRFSIRNPKHPKYDSFVRLRQAAIEAMSERKWFDGAVKMTVTIFSKPLARSLIEYVGGIMDTLDGSHGSNFTYLPIVYQDDCQVSLGKYKFVESDEERYTVEIIFLGEGAV